MTCGLYRNCGQLLSDEGTFTDIIYDVALLAKELLYGGDLCESDSEALGIWLKHMPQYASLSTH